MLCQYEYTLYERNAVNIMISLLSHVSYISVLLTDSDSLHTYNVGFYSHSMYSCMLCISAVLN